MKKIISILLAIMVFCSISPITGITASAASNTTTVVLNNQSATTAGTYKVTATYGKAMPSISVPKKTGYTFGGYYSNTNGGGTRYYTASGTSARTWNLRSSYVTLYAKWTVSASTVNLNNQSATTAGTSKVTATYGKAMPSISVPKKTGYTFGGYYSGTNGSGTQYYTASGASARTWNLTGSAVTLYAKWTASASTVNLNNQSATTAGTAKVTATYGKAMPSISVPKKTGYTFGGYYSGTNGSGTQYYTASGASARTWNLTGSAVTLYAKWTANVSTSTVTLNNQGATTAGTAKVTATYGSAMPSISVPKKTGYTFGGYYSKTNGSGTQYYTASGASARTWNLTGSAVTLYAKWTANTYKVSYNYSSGTKGSTNPASATYGTAFYVSAPTRSGYTFAGWTVTSGLNTSTAKWGTTSSPSTAVSAATTKCVNGAAGNVYFRNLTAASGATVTLTANWTESKKTCYILYDSVGFSNQAEWQKKQHENEYNVEMSEINTLKEFNAAWDAIENNADKVIIICHGSERALILEDGSSKQALSVNGYNKNGESIGNIKELKYKKISNLELYSCNTGHLDYYSYKGDKGPGLTDDKDYTASDPEGNLASILSTKISGTVLAYDGSVSFGDLLTSISGNYTPRLSTNQSHFEEINEKYGEKKRSPSGVVYYKDGKLR